MRRSGQTVLFATAIVLLVAMSVWWTVYIHRSIVAEREAALRELALEQALSSYEQGLEPVNLELCPATAAGEHDIEQRFRRRSLMVLGEGALLFVLVGICVVMLWRLVREEGRRFEAMRRFISTVTHEMKAPLTGIKSLLQTAAAGKLPDGKRSELMSMGIAETERLEHMIENVLIAGRLRTDHQPIRMSITRLGDLLDGFVEHRRGILTRPESLGLEYAAGAREAEVLVDPDGMRVILENLVDNAFKYGGDDPRVAIEVGDRQGKVIIDVVDAGMGFEPSEAESIFQPFYRSVSSTSRSHHGTGLGLNIARTLARRMGGDVIGRSEGPGKGSRFTVELPGRPG